MAYNLSGVDLDLFHAANTVTNTSLSLLLVLPTLLLCLFCVLALYSDHSLNWPLRVALINILYISELKQGTNRSLVSFTSLVISSDNVNRGLVLLLLLCLIYKPGHN